MGLTEKDIKRAGVIFLIILLGILAFLIIKPVIFSIIAGLLLAYIFIPIDRWLKARLKSSWLSATIITFTFLFLVFVPLWFLAPTLLERISEIFQASQNIAINDILSSLFPTISEPIIIQISVATNNAIGQINSAIISSITGLLIDFALVSLHVVLILFVFFFTLKDQEKLRIFMSGLSPLNKSQEKSLLKQFKDITSSIIYGQVIVGILQGILAGLGFLVFGIPNVLVLTLVAIVLSVIPVIGPGLLYLPVTFYLFINGNPVIGIGYLLYNILIVSTLDGVIRAHIVSRKTQLSQVVVLVGMVGGLIVFGAIGLILGPLILAYLLTFLEAYKENTISSFFAS